MVKTEKTNCSICGVEITGYGTEHLNKNLIAHMNQQHPQEEEVEEVDLTNMTKKELKAFAKENGFDSCLEKGMKKDEMVDAITNECYNNDM